jgi:hypothetical protein
MILARDNVNYKRQRVAVHALIAEAAMRRCSLWQAKLTLRLQQIFEHLRPERLHGRSSRCVRGMFCRLTFELSGRRRRAAARRPVKMYRVPPAGGRRPAVGAPLERGVRPHSFTTYDEFKIHAGGVGQE